MTLSKKTRKSLRDYLGKNAPHSPAFGRNSLLLKLSLRNAKRQAKDYLVYFATVIMAAALIYAFNGFIFSDELQELSSRMENLPIVIIFASIVVVCIIGWLVHYTTGFMLTKRSRELGTYMLIGLEPRQVTRLFLVENLIIGGSALALGILTGCLLYQILRAIALTLFGLPYHLSFSLHGRSRTDAFLFCPDLPFLPDQKQKADPLHENLRSYLL